MEQKMAQPYQPPPDPYKPLDPNQAYPLESVPQEQQGYASQPPPSYYSANQPQPSSTVIVTQPQPTAVVVAPPQEDHSGKAIAALILSIIGLVFCGYTLLVLVCLVPALILAIVALASPNEHSSSTHSFVSIGLSIGSIVFGVIIIAAIIAVPVVLTIAVADAVVRGLSNSISS
jgi:hypothetical protein